ncbi:hypothetical protein ACFQHO_15510 [Actinomadura yumaensis]
MRARDLSLRGSRGWVFQGVDLDVPAGGLAAVGGSPVRGVPRCCWRSAGG